MSKPTVSAIIVVGVLSLGSEISRAECIEEPHKISLDALGERARKVNVLLKSYKCNVGEKAGAAAIRIEFLRLSPTAAGLILAGGSSKALRETIGSPKVLSNDVTKTYADLVTRFGEIENVTRDDYPIFKILPDKLQTVSTDAPEPAPEIQERIDARKIRHIDNEAHPETGYPAVEELSALRKMVVPKTLNYYYEKLTDCGRDAKNILCTKFSNDKVELRFWRPMQATDVTNYVANTKSYNSQLAKVSKNADLGALLSANTPTDLRMIAYMAGDSWPDDLLILTGVYIGGDEGCLVGVSGSGLYGWSFGYVARKIALDVVLLQNISRQPIVVDSLLGDRSSNPRLRAIALGANLSGNDSPLDNESETLAPGVGILAPIRIVVAAPDDWTNTPKFQDSANLEIKKALADLLESRGYKTEALYKAIPKVNDYAYGPELVIKGASVNGTRVDLAKTRAANYIDLTATDEAGSCPHLLSWDDNDRDWVNLGKVLHKAPSQDRAYTEVRTFDRLRTRFRIEEREPEVAHLSRVSLVAKLQNGGTIELSPDETSLVAGNAGGFELLWGEGANINFTLPDNIPTESVAESKFEITGYYERYSGIAAQMASDR